MPGNSFGSLFRITTFGESHGPAIGCVIDGCPPNIDLDLTAVQRWLTRRRPGQSKLVTPRDEKDHVQALSGLDEETGKTLGTPICLVVHNTDQRSSSYGDWHHIYRPSHADYGYDARYGIRAWQGGGRSSARETIGRVAAGALAEQILHQQFPKLRICAWVHQVHDHSIPEEAAETAVYTREQADAHPTRCPHPETATAIETAILAAKSSGDSLGGIIRLAIHGFPAGYGDPVFDKLEALLAQAMLSIPACKGFDVGSGFGGACAMNGISHNDPFQWQDGELKTTSNRSGGIQGGISNGMPITCTMAFKPTATVLVPQDSADDQGNNVTLQAKGRHDPCVLPRAVPIVEAMAALVLCDALMKRSGQNI